MAITSPGFVGPTPQEAQLQRQQLAAQGIQVGLAAQQEYSRQAEAKRQYEINTRLNMLDAVAKQNGLSIANFLASDQGKAAGQQLLGPLFGNQTDAFMNSLIQAPRSAEEQAALASSGFARGDITAAGVQPPTPSQQQVLSGLIQPASQVQQQPPTQKPQQGITYTPTQQTTTPAVQWRPVGTHNMYSSTYGYGKGPGFWEVPSKDASGKPTIERFTSEEEAKAFAATQGGGDAEAKKQFYDALVTTYKNNPALLGGIVPKSKTPEELVANNASAFERWKKGEPLTGALWGRQPAPTSVPPAALTSQVQPVSMADNKKFVLSAAVESKVATPQELQTLVDQVVKPDGSVDLSTLDEKGKSTWTRFMSEQTDKSVAEIRKTSKNPQWKYEVASSITDEAVRRALASSTTIPNMIGVAPEMQPALSKMFIDTASLSARAAEAQIKKDLAAAGYTTLQASMLYKEVQQQGTGASLDYLKARNSSISTVVETLKNQLAPYQAGYEEAMKKGGIGADQWLKNLRKDNPESYATYIRLRNDLMKQVDALSTSFGDRSALGIAIKPGETTGTNIPILSWIFGPTTQTPASAEIYRDITGGMMTPTQQQNAAVTPAPTAPSATDKLMTKYGL